MTISINSDLLKKIDAHGESCYPDEGAGFLLGREGEPRQVEVMIPLPNARETSRHNRYQIAAEDYLKAELEAERLELEILGVFHSHPDHPNAPSEFDREWAQPWFSYIIISIQAGKAVGSRCWRLHDDRSQFTEESIQVTGI
jgi:proteasome lid subunit RPN8/RPN11